MTINDFGTHPPYGTAWNGLDEDNDWDLWSGDIINTGVFNIKTLKIFILYNKS